MDERIEAILKAELGDRGFRVVAGMLEEMEMNSGTVMKDNIRKRLEVAADEEGIQTGEHRAV